MILLQVVQNTTYMSNQDFWLYVLSGFLGNFIVGLLIAVLGYKLWFKQNRKAKKQEIYYKTLAYIEMLKSNLITLRYLKREFKSNPKKEEVERIKSKLVELKIEFSTVFGIKYQNGFDKILTSIDLFLSDYNDAISNALRISEEEYITNTFNQFYNEIKSAYK